MYHQKIKSPCVEIMIVNWNSKQQLHDSLSSIVSTNKDGFEIDRVIVVDNNSSDNSLGGLEKVKLPLTIIRNSENRGFAAACNQGVKKSKTDYLLFLNPDTLLFKDSLTKPLAFMEKAENQYIGIVGIQLIDEKRHISRTCSRFPTPGMFFSKMSGLNRIAPKIFPDYFMTEWNHNENQEVDHVIGAFFLVRRFLFEKFGGFDEHFFVYLEDLDFSLQVKQANWKLTKKKVDFYLAETKAYHKGGGTSEQVKATRLFYSLRSRILYGYKHFDKPSATLLMLGTLFLEPLSRLVLALFHLSKKEISETLKAYTMLWHNLPNFQKLLKQ